MAPTIIIESFGVNFLQRALLRIGTRAVASAPALEAIATLMIESERQQFETEGGHASGGWAPLAASTIEKKAKEGLDPRILHATLQLQSSLTERGNPEMILEVAPGFIRFGTTTPHARYHQDGTSHVPQRKPIDFREIDRVAWVKILQRWIMRGELVV